MSTRWNKRSISWKWIALLIAGVALVTVGAKGCENPEAGHRKSGRGEKADRLKKKMVEKRFLVHMRAGGSAREKQITVGLPGESRRTFTHIGVWQETYHNVPRGTATLLVIDLDEDPATHVTCLISVNKVFSREVSSKHLSLVRCQRDLH